MSKKLRVNIVSESEISVQGHGVHTAYEEMANSLEQLPDVEVIRGHFGEQVDCDIVHLHTVGPRTFKKLFQKNVKVVISAHVVPDSFVGSLVFARFWKIFAIWYLRWFYNQADLLLAVSDQTAHELKELGVKSPIEVMYNSIDTNKYKSSTISPTKTRADLGIPKDAFVVIGAGQVQPRKRVDCFITAAKALPDVHFIWVGGMPFGKIAADNRAMQRMIDKPPINMHFAGIVPLDQMSSYYHAADMFWLPSEQETFGLVVIEAAASGLPVMVRDIPDYDNTFGHESIRASDDAGFIREIQKLKDDKRYFAKYRTLSKKIADRFDSRKSAVRLVGLYRKLL